MNQGRKPMTLRKYLLFVLLTSVVLHTALKVGDAFVSRLHNTLTSLTMVLVFGLGNAGLHDWSLTAAALAIWWSGYFVVAGILVFVGWRLAALGKG
jgi:hypothetical protein